MPISLLIVAIVLRVMRSPLLIYPRLGICIREKARSQPKTTSKNILLQRMPKLAQ
ncbi:MAG: hypothetical protein HC903_02660 [Methylacidiphilales bacterium]|nr:hypothetical protein [Candidatus Methylacidiphilales bacterium]NJR16572.1 hypothetical protein [Calothrix sp. CSU_2_0]